MVTEVQQIMEGNINEDMWTPFKELLNVVEGAVARPVDTGLDQLEKYLQKHKQNFFTLLKNPLKNSKSREDLQKGITEGISLPGIGHQTLPQELVDEAIIISDMYDLNEYMALDLLCTAHHQMPYHPGLTRGLVAILLYYDGKKALVTALRVLVQARQGNLWTVDCHPDVSNYITNYTDELLANGLISKILNILDSLDLSKEMELLQKNRALGGPKHHHQVVGLYQGIRQTLADIVYLWAAQSGLPKQPTLELIGLLRRTKCQEDSCGGIDNVLLALQMALLYAIDVGVLHKRQDGEELMEKLPLLEQPDFVNNLMTELSSNSRPWEYCGIQALTQFAWGVSLATLRMAPPSLQPQGLVDEDDVLVDMAVDSKVFNFFHTSFLLNETIFKEEFYLRRMHCLLTDFIALMPLKVKELRNRADEAAKTVQVYAQEGLDPPPNLPHNFEDLLLTLAMLYYKDPLNLNLELEFWCSQEGLPTSYPYRTPPRQVPLFKFVRQSGDLLPPTLYVPYMKMLSSLSSCREAARQCFCLLKQNSLNTVTWDHFFNSFSRYYSNLRQELPPTTDTVYRHRSYPKGITAQEIQALLAVLGVIKTVAEYDDVSRIALCENPAWAPLTVLLGLVSCCIQIPLKAELLLTLAALAKSPDTAATLWHNLEASQILVTIPSTSSFQPRGIQTELEELESRNEEFPLTRAMLCLLNVLTDVPIPRLLGVGNRTPGFDPYLTFVIQSVFLRFNNRSYKNPQEKWEVCQSCLQLLVKLLAQYEPQGEDFVGGQVQIQGGAISQVNPPPGYHLMVNLCTKSELLRMVLYIIDEGCILLDTYSLFPGKSQLEASTASCLQLLDTALSSQQKFLMIHSNVNSSMLLTPLNKLLLGVNPRTGKPDHLLSIARYVTYNSWLPNHALLSVRILLAVTSYPTPQSHMVSIFTSTQQLKTFIRHGFVECFESDADEVVSEGLEEEDIGIVGRTKEAICKLLLQCLNHSQPNLAHYLLGFELNKDIKHSIFQQPGVLGFPRTCLHSILTLLTSSLQARSNPTSQPPHPKLIELCYRLIFSLTANVRSSEPVLRFLRSGEFLQKHLAALPFKSENKGSDLNQMSWLLKTVAIELKVTASHQQLSQFTGLVHLLVSHGSDETAGDAEMPTAPVLASQLTSTFNNSTTNFSTNPLNHQLILRLLREFEFFVEPVQQPTWEFFDSQQISRVIKQCESAVGTGLRLIDIKTLHKILMEELSAVQGSSTASHRQLIMQEIQLILKYALKQNQQRNIAASTIHFLDAWRQVTEVMFAVALPESLPFESRFCLLLEILHELLNKVLLNNVIAEMANLSSGAILLLFVDLRNCFTLEHSKVVSGGIESINKLNALVHSRENILKNIMASIIKWILSSGVASQKIRANLYASLLNFLHLTRQQSPIISQTPETSQSMLSTFSEQKSITDEEGNLLLGSRNASLEVLAGYGERLVTVICHDCSGGHDVCKMLALSCLDMMIELDPHGTWITFLSARGYLKFLIDSLLESDNQLCDLLSPVLKTLRPLYVYESKMALLCRVASTAIGSELLLEQNALSCLSAMQVFDTHPDITTSVSQRKAKLSELDFIPSISSRYLQILSPALSLCETVLSSLGVENESAVVQVIHFLLSHGDTVSMILRSGSPFLPVCYLNELAQLTGVVARATNQSVRKKISDQCADATAMLETTSHFHRIQKLMLTLLSQFVVSDSVLKDIANSVDIDRNKPQDKGKAVNCFLQIAANLVLYARNLVVSTGVDRRVTSVVLQPTLLDPLVAERREVGLGGEASLGIIVQQLVQCVKHYHIEKDALDFLSQHLNSVSDMNTTSVKEFLSEEISSYSALDECRQQAGRVLKARVTEKMQELQLYNIVIEHCLYLLWSHLDYYMLRAIPNKTLGLDKSMKLKGKTTQMGEITWAVSVDEINQLKQGLISILNDTFCKNLINTTQEQTSTEKGFIEALLRRIKKLIQFVPVK